VRVLRWASLAVTVAGCGFSPGAAVTDAALHDGGADAVDAMVPSDATETFTECLGAFEHICVVPPSQSVTLATGTIDTDSSPLCVHHSIISGTSVCVVAGTAISLAVGTTVVVKGARPLVLLSTGAITLDGVLDVSSNHSGMLGAGGNATDCRSAMTTATTTGLTSGGGAGASFGGIGGDGGNGSPIGGNGGKAAPADGNATFLRGGCPGYKGAGMGGGAGGDGGGGLLVLAHDNVHVGGTLNASGAAGSGGTTTSSGAGGGGTGGLLAFEANFVTVTASAKIFANGGGGGEGADQTVTGNTGKESTAPLTVGSGGNGTNNGGNGGDGSVGTARNAAAGTAGAAAGGGGGGGAGGGAGLVKNFSSGQSGMGGTNVSPPAT